MGPSVRAGSIDSSSDRASGSDFPVMVAGTSSCSCCTAITADLYVYKRAVKAICCNIKTPRTPGKLDKSAESSAAATVTRIIRADNIHVYAPGAFDDLTGRFVGGRWRHQGTAAIRREMGERCASVCASCSRPPQGSIGGPVGIVSGPFSHQTVGTEMLVVSLGQGSRLCTQSCKTGP